MERRRLILAALGMGAGTLTTSGESLRQLLDLTLDTETRSIEDWEMACDDHLYALRTRPAAQVRDDVMIDLLAIQRQLGNSERTDKDLSRVVAALATLNAAALTRLGEHGAAIRWWRTARTAADDSGDLELRLGVRATEAGHGRYGQRPPEMIVRLTQDARQLAGKRSTTGMALVTCAQAKALAALGRRTQALRALNTYKDLAEVAPAPKGIMPSYWNGGHLPFAENLVHAYCGDQDKASRAAGSVLASGNPDHQSYPLVGLHGAACTVINGGIDEGVKHASGVLNAVPASHRSHMLTATGKEVLQVVPAGQRQRPAVREYREVLSCTAPAQRALPSAT